VISFALLPTQMARLISPLETWVEFPIPSRQKVTDSTLLSKVRTMGRWCRITDMIIILIRQKQTHQSELPAPLTIFKHSCKKTHPSMLATRIIRRTRMIGRIRATTNARRLHQNSPAMTHRTRLLRLPRNSIPLLPSTTKKRSGSLPLQIGSA